MKKLQRELLFLIPAIAIYAWFAYELDFFQDDAYISFRFVANYLNGDGLVFNIGEAIEGYTNFGWVIYLSFLGVLGLNYIAAAKISGLCLGALVIIASFVTGRLLFHGHNVWLAIVAATLVGANQSLAYWSPAGLETAAFALCASMSLYFYMTKNYLLICSILFAVLLRPEGALIAGLIIIIELIQSKSLPKFTLLCTAIALIFSLPWLGWKLYFYGSIIPNPFYAKTSFDISQLNNGLEYVWRFLSHYGFYGIPVLGLTLLWKKLSTNHKAILLFTIGYTLYLVLIGGDVIKVHRFFIPLIGLYAIITVSFLHEIMSGLKGRYKYYVLSIGLILSLVLTYHLPSQFVSYYNFTERAFTAKMKFQAEQLKKWDSSDFSVAIPTIGIFGYTLMGHDIIDMLGLTDSTIAKYSDEPIEGMQSTWKESKHNSVYLLNREPSYISFSTGMKPSAPAEKALMLYPQFLHSYRSIGWLYRNAEFGGNNVAMITTFKKVRPYEGELKPTYPLEFVDQYKLGLEALMRSDYKSGITHFNLSIQASPKPYYQNLICMKANLHQRIGQLDLTERLYNIALEQDSLTYEAHAELYVIYSMNRSNNKIALHRKWLERLVPWYLPQIDSIIAQIQKQ